MAKLFLTFLSFFIAAGAVALTISVLWLASSYNRAGPLKQETIVEIEKGSSLNAIAHDLKTKNIIHSETAFIVLTRILDRHKSLQAGEYRFGPGQTIREVKEKLASGAVYQRSLTIKEGLTSIEIMELLNQAAAMEGRIETPPAQGTVLPETYFYEKGVKRKDMLRRMKSLMDATLDTLWKERSRPSVLKSKEEAVILASIIEKEAGNRQEMDKIAGVFVNRLKKGMRLQSDPTVIFAITKGEPERAGYGPLGRRLNRKDWDYESPYNTYRNAGLPPGPICHPGRESLRAALNPANHDYYYFVANGDGGHAFARTLDDHNRNVMKWREIRDN